MTRPGLHPTYFIKRLPTDAIKKYDPEGIFQNNFGRRITKNGTKIDIDPFTTRCALLDNCFCSNNSDCADTQSCISISGYTYPVCKTRNEVAETKFDRSLLPPPSGLLDWLLTIVPTLVTAVVAKCPILGLVNTIVPNVLGSLLG